MLTWNINFRNSLLGPIYKTQLTKQNSHVIWNLFPLHLTITCQRQSDYCWLILSTIFTLHLANNCALFCFAVDSLLHVLKRNYREHGDHCIFFYLWSSLNFAFILLFSVLGIKGAVVALTNPTEYKRHKCAE